MCESRNCKFIALFTGVLAGIITGILIYSGVVTISVFQLPLIITTAVASVIFIIMTVIITIFEILPKTKIPECLCNKAKWIVTLAALSSILNSIGLIGLVSFSLAVGAIALGIMAGVYVALILLVICLVNCIIKRNCKCECI